MKRLNNKILVAALLALVAAFVFTKLFRSPSRERNLDADLLKIDTTGITEIRLYPASEKRREIKLIRNEKGWVAAQDDVSGPADKNAVTSLLGTLASLEPERIVTRKKEKWETYNTGDTTGTTVAVFEEGAEQGSLVIGKESSGLTYIRRAGEEDVYAATGYLSGIFNKPFSHWRNGTFLRLNPTEITRITFHYPADSGFVAEKKDNIWMIGNEPADSLAVSDYLGKLRFKDLSDFADDFSATQNPDVTVTVEGKAMTLATVKGWKRSFYQWILSSSIQPGVHFLDEGPAQVKDLFVSKEIFLKKKSVGK